MIKTKICVALNLTYPLDIAKKIKQAITTIMFLPKLDNNELEASKHIYIHDVRTQGLFIL